MGPDFSGAFKLANLFAGGGSARGHDAFIEGQTAASRVQQALAQALANRELARSRRIQNDAVSSFPALFASAPSFFGGDETLRSEIGPLFAAIAQGNPDIDPRRLAETLALTERFNQQRRLLSDIEAGTFDPNRANSISQVFADEPVDLTKIAGNTAFNPLVTPDQNDFLTTEVGQSVINRNEAAAERSRRPSATRSGQSAGSRVVQAFVDGELRTGFDRGDGTFVLPDGSVVPLPQDVVPLTTKDAATALRGDTAALAGIEAADAALDQPAPQRSFLEEALLRTSGVTPALGRTFERIGGLFGAESVNPEIQASRSFLNIFREEIIPSLIKNKRFPVAEQSRILALLPQTTITDLPQQIQNARQLDAALVSALSTLRANLASATTEKDQREIAAAIRETIATINRLRFGTEQAIAGQPSQQGIGVNQGSSESIPGGRRATVRVRRGQ